MPYRCTDARQKALMYAFFITILSGKNVEWFFNPRLRPAAGEGHLSGAQLCGQAVQGVEAGCTFASTLPQTNLFPSQWDSNLNAYINHANITRGLEPKMVRDGSKASNLGQ